MSKHASISPAELVARARRGEVASAARLISRLESGAGAAQIAAALAGAPEPRQVIGVTGPAGVGKSTLVSALVGVLRAAGERIAVVAVDPSSELTGGALLADRLRMGEHACDEGVFIRSLAGRGAGRGLAAAAGDALRVLGATGFARVLLETVGAGQDECAVADAADTVVLVTMPGAGDAAQDLKLGLPEMADVFVINKADRDPAGARAAAARISEVLDAQAVTCRLSRRFGPPSGEPWRPPVVVVSALTGEGVGQSVSAIDAHQHYLEASGLGAQARRVRLRQEIIQRAATLFETDLRAQAAQIDQLAEACREGRLDVHAAARKLAGPER